MSNTNKPLRHFGFQQRHQHRAYRLLLVTAVALLVGLIYLFYAWSFSSRFIVTNDAYVSGNLAPLKAQTSGTVVDIRVDNTQYVHQGEVLIRLDGLQAQVALERAKANLADSVRQIETLFSQADMLRQKMATKEAILNRSQRDLIRYRNVANDGAVSAQQIENTEFNVREQEADVRQIRAELGGAVALIQNTSPADNPKVLQAVAALKQAYLDQARQQIVAPMSGFVAKRSIQIGEQVRPETPLLVIVPLDYVWVEANFLENELADVQPGQSVEITVDLYGSNMIYQGVVLGLGAGTGSVFGLLPPDNATGNYIHIVERVPVRIGLRSEELQAHPLRPGLSAVARIDTSSSGHSVLEPLTTTPTLAYKTEVYDHQLDGSDALIAKIIEQNRRLIKIGG
jgi:membrane fusion protein (multidrug efflux system)